MSLPEATHSEETVSGAMNTVEVIREKILYALKVWPFLSKSMIHVAIGTSQQTSMWHPILRQLIAEGIVRETQVSLRSPLDRSQSHTVYHLATNPYTYN